MSTDRTEHFAPTSEPDRLHGPVVWGSGALFVAFVVASIFVAHALMHGFARGEAIDGGQAEPAPPRIGIVEQGLVRNTQRGIDQNAEQRRSLDGWGWVDRAHGVARIPIDRAMDLVAAEGGAP